MWSKAGRYNSFWKLEPIGDEVPGILKITKRGKVTVDLLLNEDQKSTLFQAEFEKPLEYPVVTGRVDAVGIQNPVSLVDAGRFGRASLYARYVLFGLDLAEQPDPVFSRIVVTLGDLGNWPLVSQGSPIAVPVRAIETREDHAIDIHMPRVLSGTGKAPHIGLSPRAQVTNATRLVYEFEPTLRWDLDLPLTLGACLDLVHCWYSFVILLAASVVEVNTVALRTPQDTFVQVVYEPVHVAGRTRHRRAIVRLNDIGESYPGVAVEWERLHACAREAIAVAVGFHYVQYLDAARLFELVTGLESLHRALNPRKKLKLRERLTEFASLLVSRQLLTAKNRDVLVDGLVDARNDYGHALRAQGTRDQVRLTHHAHLMLSSVLLDQLGLLDIAFPHIKSQWEGWARW
jgi:hypothetical protein